MKIVIFGATGTVGQRIASEALSRGHEVTAVVRDPERAGLPQGLAAVQGDARDPKSVAQVAANHDAAISAVGPGGSDNSSLLSDTAHGLIEGLPKAGVKRLL